MEDFFILLSSPFFSVRSLFAPPLDVRLSLPPSALGAFGWVGCVWFGFGAFEADGAVRVFYFLAAGWRV